MNKIVENVSDEDLDKIEKDFGDETLHFETINKTHFANLNHKEGLKEIIKLNFYNQTLSSDVPGIQCTRGRHRSAGDLFLLMKYYYPDITFKETRSLIYELVNEYHILTTYCSDINKRVFWRGNEQRLHISLTGQEHPRVVYSEECQDEYGYKLKLID